MIIINLPDYVYTTNEVSTGVAPITVDRTGQNVRVGSFYHFASGVALMLGKHKRSYQDKEPNIHENP